MKTQDQHNKESVIVNILMNINDKWIDLMENDNSGIVIISHSGKIKFISLTFEKWLGFEEGELEGCALTRLIPNRFREKHSNSLRNYLETGEKTVMGSWVVVPILNKNKDELLTKLCITENESSFIGIFNFIE